MSLHTIDPVGERAPLASPKKRGRRKNTPAMTRGELDSQIARVGSRSALARALPCSRSSLHSWSRGLVNISAAWAARIRLVPVAPPRTPAEAAAARMRARQLVLPLAESVSPPEEPS
jgi:hypothetical protein